MNRTVLYILFSLCISAGCLKAEDGSRLWLRAEKTASAQVKANRKSPAVTVAIEELKTQWRRTVQLNIHRNKELRELGKDCYIISGDKHGNPIQSVPT
jgi:hypothetical protein